MLLRWIVEVGDEELLLDPADHGAEDRTNTWSIGGSVDQRAGVSAEQILDAFENTAEALRARVRNLDYSGPATFYVWHDRQAGCLRCSTTSLPPDALPFGGAHVATADLAPIVQEFLDEDEPGTVSFSDLHELSDLNAEEPTPPPFPVWTRDIGREASGA